METSKSVDSAQKKMQGLKATVMMIAAELTISGITIFYKLATNDGMHISILIAYRYLFASLIILPLALFIERNKRPKLTLNILFQAFLCAVFGGPMAQILYAESLVLTSATYASAFTNLAPSFTFIIGALFGMEKVEIGTRGGKAKVIGTLVGVARAMVLTFYKGHQLNIWSTHFHTFINEGQHMDGHVEAAHMTSLHHSIGSLFALASSLSAALYFTLQGKMSAVYPCHYSCTFLVTIIGFAQSFVFALCTERSWSQWKFSWNIRLLACLFAGIASSLSVLFITTSIHLQGPLFVSNFNPLMLIFVAIVGSLVLGENLHVGSILGAVIIVVGLYVMLWGKSNLNRLSKRTTSMGLKDVNDALNINDTTTTLDTMHVARASFSINGEDN